MISKVDFRDFFEINQRLFGDNPAHAAQVEFLMRMLASLEGRRAEWRGQAEELPRH